MNQSWLHASQTSSHCAIAQVPENSFGCFLIWGPRNYGPGLVLALGLEILLGGPRGFCSSGDQTGKCHHSCTISEASMSQFLVLLSHKGPEHPSDCRPNFQRKAPRSRHLKGEEPLQCRRSKKVCGGRGPYLHVPALDGPAASLSKTVTCLLGHHIPSLSASHVVGGICRIQNHRPGREQRK